MSLGRKFFAAKEQLAGGPPRAGKNGVVTRMIHYDLYALQIPKKVGRNAMTSAGGAIRGAHRSYMEFLGGTRGKKRSFLT